MKKRKKNTESGVLDVVELSGRRGNDGKELRVKRIGVQVMGQWLWNVGNIDTHLR